MHKNQKINAKFYKMKISNFKKIQKNQKLRLKKHNNNQKIKIYSLLKVKV